MSFEFAPHTGPVGTPPAGGTNPLEECAIGGCRIPAARNARGYCAPHDDVFLTRVYEMSHDIGRGSHE